MPPAGTAANGPWQNGSWRDTFAHDAHVSTAPSVDIPAAAECMQMAMRATPMCRGAGTRFFVPFPSRSLFFSRLYVRVIS
jgi:hypothetical protein